MIDVELSVDLAGLGRGDTVTDCCCCCDDDEDEDREGAS